MITHRAPFSFSHFPEFMLAQQFYILSFKIMFLDVTYCFTCECIISIRLRSGWKGGKARTACPYEDRILSTKYFWEWDLWIWTNLCSCGLCMSADYGMLWEESQFVMSTLQLFELGVCSKMTLWYGMLSITMTEFGCKFGIIFSCSHFHNFQNI
jgi:hypothetical protein